MTPQNAAAAGFSVAPPPPIIGSRRAAAADHKHPARRRRQNSVVLGLYVCDSAATRPLPKLFCANLFHFATDVVIYSAQPVACIAFRLVK